MSIILLVENVVAMDNKKIAQNILAAFSREKDPHDASIPRAKCPVHIPSAENVRIYEDAVCDMQLTSLSPYQIDVPTRFATCLISGKTASVERLRTLPLNYALKLNEMMLEGYKMGRDHLMEDIRSSCVIVHNEDALKIKKKQYDRGFFFGKKIAQNEGVQEQDRRYKDGFNSGKREGNSSAYEKGWLDQKQDSAEFQIKKQKSNFNNGLMKGLGVGVVATLGIGLCVYSKYDQKK